MLAKWLGYFPGNKEQPSHLTTMSNHHNWKQGAAITIDNKEHPSHLTTRPYVSPDAKNKRTKGTLLSQTFYVGSRKFLQILFHWLFGKDISNSYLWQILKHCLGKLMQRGWVEVIFCRDVSDNFHLYIFQEWELYEIIFKTVDIRVFDCPLFAMMP